MRINTGLPLALSCVALLTACSHPLEIVGEGDILSASGDRSCLLEEYRAEAENCVDNTVSGAYQETYYAQPRSGWTFDRWENYCIDATNNECSFDVSVDVVQQAWGQTASPLRAVFVENDPAPEVCNTVFDENDVYIIDLSEDSETPGACGLLDDENDIADCVAGKIRAAFDHTPECLSTFDVFVPGTSSEDGSFKQFTEIMSSSPGRTYLSLQYSYESTLWDDKMPYDKSTAEAQTALKHLLNALEHRFDDPDVRVFGHSKGSDAVARVSRNTAYDDVQFFAFAQPGRTPSDVRGTPGYVEKLDDNLVVLTWQNDEVKFYSGGQTGFQTPETWGFPGYVNQAGGGQTAWPSRIDHHDTYGGDYEKKAYPYCATGNKLAMFLSECKSQNGVRYRPWFWGNTQCTNIAFDMMNTGSTGDRYYIGYSGPRAAGCKDTVSNITASYSLRYSMNIADQDDCEYKMELAFRGLDFGVTRPDGDKITVSSRVDKYGVRKTGTVSLPLHMHLNWKASMKDVSGKFSKCINYAGAKSEGYIHSLVVSFYHPRTGEYTSRTLIGNSEGVEYLWPLKLADKNNVAWRKTSGDWDLHFGIPPSYPYDALMVKGSTTDNINGQFYKWVHLLD